MKELASVCIILLMSDMVICIVLVMAWGHLLPKVCTLSDSSPRGKLFHP